jgi:hypothetical protein
MIHATPRELPDMTEVLHSSYPLSPIDTTGVTLQNADDCIDAASLEYTPYSAEWGDFVEKWAVQACTPVFLRYAPFRVLRFVRRGVRFVPWLAQRLGLE